MIITDHTRKACETLISRAIPAAATGNAPRYLSTMKEENDGGFSSLEIIADPYTVDMKDNDGIPVLASINVYANFTTPEENEATHFNEVLAGETYAFTAAEAARIIATLPEPLNLLQVYDVTPICNGIDTNLDGTATAQYQFTLSTHPIIIQEGE